MHVVGGLDPPSEIYFPKPLDITRNARIIQGVDTPQPRLGTQGLEIKMTTFTTYIARPVMSYGQPGYEDALAAASAINKSLGDSGESSFIAGDESADYSAYRAMQRELDSCHPAIRAGLMVDKTTAELDE